MRHNGGNGVFYTMMARYLDRGISYVFATNDWRNSCPDGEERRGCLGNLAVEAELRGLLFGDRGS
jgi:hypothetical protein